MQGQLLPEQRILAIVEELAGFIFKEIIDDAGEFSVNRRYWSPCNRTICDLVPVFCDLHVTM